MGGGDLNLKKSWHPHTMKNQERVWKAEQAKQEEQRKLDDLRKEINEERDREELRRIGENSGVLAGNNGGEAKLEWMYKNSAELINREEYLLGRKIDKSFEQLQAEERRTEQTALGLKQSINHVEHECVPFSIREYRNLQSTEQVDMQRKTMEDPLMLIKQREMESRRKLLENPVKLKEIHRILKTEQEQALKRNKKSKKSKKSKKKKHKKGSGSEDSDDSDDSDDSNDDLDRKLAKQMKKLKGENTNGDFKLDKLLDAKYRTLTKQLDMASKPKKHKKKSRKRSDSDSESSEESSEEEKVVKRRERSNSADQRTKRRGERERDQNVQRQQEAGNNRRRHSRSRSPRRDHQPQRRRSRSPRRDQQRERSRSPRRDHQPQRRRSRTPKRDQQSQRQRTRSPRRDQQHQLRRSRSADKSRTQRREQSRERSRDQKPRRSRTPVKQQQQRRNPSPPPAASRRFGSKPKLSEAEREARLREMMENATWREADRTKVVKKHREEYAREEAQNQARDFDKGFINKEVKKALDNQTSIGNRIRSNLNNIQRTSSAMDSNFARK